MVVPARERMQIGEREPAPRRAQDREPGDAIAEVQERTRERMQVLDDRHNRERLHVDGTERQAGTVQLA